MDSDEFTDWIAYERIDPFGNQRGDLQAATVTSMIYAAHRGKSDKALGPSDFMPDFGSKPQENVGDQVRAAFICLKANQSEDNARGMMRTVAAVLPHGEGVVGGNQTPEEKQHIAEMKAQFRGAANASGREP